MLGLVEYSSQNRLVVTSANYAVSGLLWER